MRNGIFITFEGVEGSGKSTFIKRAVELIEGTLGYDVVLTREPGGTELSEILREIVTAGKVRGIKLEKEVCPKAEFYIYLASRAQHINDVIKPGIEAGKVVICDRFQDSTMALQGFGRELCPQKIIDASSLTMEDMWPDLTIILDLPVEIGLERSFKKAKGLTQDQQELRFEQLGIDFHNRVREGFKWIAANAEQNGRRIEVVDATGTIDEVWERVKKELMSYFCP